jgi:hypothetical protein
VLDIKFDFVYYNDSVVGVAIIFGLGGPEIESRERQKIFSSPKPSRPALRIHSLLFNGYGDSFTG